ncbi:hypothetical protein Agabi119p4_2343 [Agaricus bisporus var. burnettii]|uniref:Uncharacterized protein n=1 Tax=Agaricus bisporus var. burnettii TaxID=192524 RepID=A0A8H7F932_AGABI|nr:hypothetical protein Agabi119p4_2343 [Agaricus bisporus var. burnettii]
MSDHKVASTLNEALTLFSHTTVVGVLYTFNLILYCLCARLSFSWLRALDEKRRTAFTLILASVIIICGTFHVALKNHTKPRRNASTNIELAAVIAEILTLGVLLWRVWVVYTGTRFALHVIVLASLFYLAYSVSNILQLAFIWAPLSSAFQTLTRTLDIVVVLTLAFSAASKIMMTLLIILRLLFIRQKHTHPFELGSHLIVKASYGQLIITGSVKLISIRLKVDYFNINSMGRKGGPRHQGSLKRLDINLTIHSNGCVLNYWGTLT